MDAEWEYAQAVRDAFAADEAGDLGDVYAQLSETDLEAAYRALRDAFGAGGDEAGHYAVMRDGSRAEREAWLARMREEVDGIFSEWRDLHERRLAREAAHAPQRAAAAAAHARARAAAGLGGAGLAWGPSTALSWDYGII